MNNIALIYIWKYSSSSRLARHNSLLIMTIDVTLNILGFFPALSFPRLTLSTYYHPRNQRRICASREAL